MLVDNVNHVGGTMDGQDGTGKPVEEVGMDVLRDSLTDVVGRAGFANERFVVTRSGKPIAGLIGMRDLERLLALDAA